MLRRSSVSLDKFKEHYHRVNLPRRIVLAHHIKREQRRLAKATQQKQAADAQAAAKLRNEKFAPEVPYRYNRWWVNAGHEFVHQYAYIEDPDVIEERRRALPACPTKEDIWKTPQKTTFLPFMPFIKVVDYGKDPDAKLLKPVNIPRWKEYMMRTKPVVPRTWY
eukprot:Tbor_TRINITY_DN5356_c4_g1::TRINITY_DN5356_c4_g1_i1::g.4288::m.4288